jgi:hypothetical protein
MIKTYYYPNILRKLNLSLIGLFSGIQVAKKDNRGNTLEYRQVPIRFAHKQKFIPLLSEDGQSNMMWFNQHLPAMVLMIDAISYDPSKTRGGFDSPIFSYTDTNDVTRKMFSGTPYKISYTLGILSMHMNEVSMIMEQVLPRFNPFHNITIREWDFLPELTRDIKVGIGGSVKTNFDTEVPEDRFRKIEFEIPFEASCNFYLPVQISDIVKHVKVNLNSSFVEDISGGFDTYNYEVSGSEENYDILTDEWSNG